MDSLGEPIMTGYMSRHFRFDCRERGKCYNETLPNWDELIDGVFPRGIVPTDVDAMVEINDHILFIEQKGPSVPLQEGQRLAFRRLANRERITVLFIRGAEPNLEAMVYDDQPMQGWKSCTVSQLRQWLIRWASHADQARAA